MWGSLVWHHYSLQLQTPSKFLFSSVTLFLHQYPIISDHEISLDQSEWNLDCTLKGAIWRYAILIQQECSLLQWLAFWVDERTAPPATVIHMCTWMLSVTVQLSSSVLPFVWLLVRVDSQGTGIWHADRSL